MPQARTLVFSPETAASISDLEFVSRKVVEGFISGLHPSPYHGFALEFASYRNYTPGDDLRYLDWRAWGRSDRFYVKQFEQTTNLSCHIFLDCSASMGINAGNGVTKHRYSMMAAGALAYLMVKQGDQVGFTASGPEGRIFYPARGGRKHLFSMLAGLSRLAPETTLPLVEGIEALAHRLSHRGMCLVFSDFLHPTAELVEALKLLVRTHSELVFFEVMTEAERQFPYEGTVEFLDVEGGVRLPTQATVVRRAYLEALAVHRERISGVANEVGADFVALTPEEPLAEVLSRYLLARKRLM